MSLRKGIRIMRPMDFSKKFGAIWRSRGSNHLLNIASVRRFEPKGKFLLGTWLLQNGRKSMEVTLTNGSASTRQSHKPRQTSHPSLVHDRGKRCRRPSYTVEGTLRILSKLTEQVTWSWRRHAGMGVKWHVQPSMLSLAEEPGLGSNLYLQNIRKARVLYKSISKHAEDQRITKETGGEPTNRERTRGGAWLVE